MPAVRRLVAILNPQADRGRTAQLAESLQQAVRGRLDLSLRLTSMRGEAVDLARDAARDCDAMVAIGGDGTVHEVANGLMAVPAAERPALGIIPAGSGNDFAYANGITKDFNRCLGVLQAGASRAVDVGQVKSSIGLARYFVNNVGTLLDGQVNLASHQLRWPRGSGLYIRAVLQTLVRRPPVSRLELDVDGVAVVREATVLSIGNGPRSGGKFFLTPEAEIDDGQFNYMLACPMSRPRLMWRLIQSVRRERPADPLIEHGRFVHMTMRSSIPLAVHIDGEPWLRPAEGVHELAINVLPRELNVLCDGRAGGQRFA